MGVPFFLGAIVILTTFNTPGSDTSSTFIMFLVIATLVGLSWPVSMRIMRSAVISAKAADYVLAARALGAGAPRIIFRHLLPNTLAPVLVYATLTVGAFIGAEATLSYLGIGLTPPVISWGVAISDAKNYIRVSPHLLLFPAGFLTTTVLAFVLLGEAVREALDPRQAALRRRSCPRRCPTSSPSPCDGHRPIPAGCWRSRTCTSSSAPRTAWRR